MVYIHPKGNRKTLPSKLSPFLTRCSLLFGHRWCGCSHFPWTAKTPRGAWLLKMVSIAFKCFWNYFHGKGIIEGRWWLVSNPLMRPAISWKKLAFGGLGPLKVRDASIMGFIYYIASWQGLKGAPYEAWGFLLIPTWFPGWHHALQISK